MSIASVGSTEYLVLYSMVLGEAGPIASYSHTWLSLLVHYRVYCTE